MGLSRWPFLCLYYLPKQSHHPHALFARSELMNPQWHLQPSSLLSSGPMEQITHCNLTVPKMILEMPDSPPNT